MQAQRFPNSYNYLLLDYTPLRRGCLIFGQRNYINSAYNKRAGPNCFRISINQKVSR